MLHCNVDVHEDIGVSNKQVSNLLTLFMECYLFLPHAYVVLLDRTFCHSARQCMCCLSSSFCLVTTNLLISFGSTGEMTLLMNAALALIPRTSKDNLEIISYSEYRQTVHITELSDVKVHTYWALDSEVFKTDL